MSEEAIIEVMRQDLGLGRREVVSTQDFGRQSRAVTSREMRIIENSRLANQYGTPEYMEANDPVKRAKRAGWNALAADADDDGLGDLDMGQAHRKAKLLAAGTAPPANFPPAQMSHRPAPPHPTQPSQRQPARFAAPAPAPAARSTPRAPKNNDSNSRNAHPNGNGKQAGPKSSLAKGDLAFWITYSSASGSRINNTPTAGNNHNNPSLSRPSDNIRSAAAARLANIAHHTVPPPRAQPSRSANGQAHIPPNRPSGSRRSSSDYNNVPTGPSGRASRRQLPAQQGFDLVDPAQWLAITNAKIRPQQGTTASALQSETKKHAERPDHPAKQTSSQATENVTKQMSKSGPAPTQMSDNTSSTVAITAPNAIGGNVITKQNSNLPAAIPAKQTSSQTAETVTKPLPKTGPAPTQISGTTPSTATIPASSVTTSNAITKQNGNLATNTIAMTNDGASDKDIKKPTRTYDMATLKSLGRPSEAISRSSRPAPPQVVASEDLISISAEAPSQSKEAAAGKKDPASNGLLGLIMSNGRGSGGLAASKWAK